MARLLLIVGALVTAPRPAASQVPLGVEYVVDARALGRDTLATSILTIGLHRDPDCTQTLASATVRAQDLDLIEDVRSVKVRGVTRPRLARLNESLTGIVLAEEAPFVKVVGPGIVAAGRVCQPRVTPELAGTGLPPCLRVEGTDLILEGCNVRIDNGTGSTLALPNGKGNLIIGYNEACPPGECPTAARTGSHTLVVGTGHAYETRAGLVAGRANAIAGSLAVVAGGTSNRATGEHAVVEGGSGNMATGRYATVLGGYRNRASGPASLVLGGTDNKAEGASATVVGGASNRVTAARGVVGGGRDNLVLADAAVVVGGEGNGAGGKWACVVGGKANLAIGVAATVRGGTTNLAFEDDVAIHGGTARSDSTRSAFVCGALR